MLHLLFFLSFLFGLQSFGHASLLELESNKSEAQAIVLSLEKISQFRVLDNNSDTITQALKASLYAEKLLLSNNFVGISIGTGGVKLVVDLLAATLFAIGVLSNKSDHMDSKSQPPDTDNFQNLGGENNKDPGGRNASKKSDLKICDNVIRELRDSESEKYKHILKNPMHDLDKIGKNPDEILEKTLEVLQRTIDNKNLSSPGSYRVIDSVDGHQLEIRGAVVGNVVKIGTFFVDKNCC